MSQDLAPLEGKSKNTGKKWAIGAVGALAIFGSVAYFDDEAPCTSGQCQLSAQAPACLEKDVYAKLEKEIIYMKETGDESRIVSFFMGGRCKIFPEGTLVYVLESGDRLSKVRFIKLSDEPNRWTSNFFFE